MKKVTRPKSSEAQFDRVFEVLKQHRGRTISKAFLAELTGITDDRILRDAVSRIVLAEPRQDRPDGSHGRYLLTNDAALNDVKIAHLAAHRPHVSTRIKALEPSANWAPQSRRPTR